MCLSQVSGLLTCCLDSHLLKNCFLDNAKRYKARGRPGSNSIRLREQVQEREHQEQTRNLPLLIPTHRQGEPCADPRYLVEGMSLELRLDVD